MQTRFEVLRTLYGSRSCISGYLPTSSKVLPHSQLVPKRHQSDYLHESIVPTDHFQKSLPRLPVPELEKTCSRYLESQKAFLSADAFKQTQLNVEQFKNGPGKELQEKLKAFNQANKHTSYITGFWFDMYFKDRRPVVLNHNPFMSFKLAPSPELNNQLVRATNMVVSSLKYCKTLRANILEPEVFHLNPKKSDTLQFRKFVRLLPKSLSFYGAYWYKAFPLDMSQFSSLFNSSRIPKKGKDVLHKNDKAKHLLVIRNGHIYTFDCLDSRGDILPASQIMSSLRQIMEDNSPPPSHPLGYLTSENRDVWAAARDELLANGNSEQLELVDTALFALCLDSDVPADIKSHVHRFLHGSPANRWYDKSFSLILEPNGETAVNFEHSWGDGVAVMSYFNAVFHDSNNNPSTNTPDLKADSAAVRKLEFKMSDASKAHIEQAKKQFDDSVSKLQVNFLEYNDMGKDAFKAVKLSPDSMMQLAFQMAYRKCYGHTAATYESCSTSAFKHGRTETIRPATTATNSAFDLFSKNASKSDLMAALTECSTVHGELTKNAAMGQGWDRHLFALRKFAEEASMEVPLYGDEAYQLINSIALSTSTLSSQAVQTGAFAPVIPQGLGVGYSINDKWLGAVVSSYAPHKTPDDFINALKDSFNQIKLVVS